MTKAKLEEKAADIDYQMIGSELFVLLSKTENKSGLSVETKAMEIQGFGCLVHVTTQQQNPDGSYAVAEALSFVPQVHIEDDDNSGRKLVWNHAPKPEPVIIDEVVS